MPYRGLGHHSTKTERYKSSQRGALGDVGGGWITSTKTWEKRPESVVHKTVVTDNSYNYFKDLK